MKIIVISGRSGSGKSIALRTLEDLGFYCIDNLPIRFLLELQNEIGQYQPNVAASIDSRNIPTSSSTIDAVIAKLRSIAETKVIYLEAPTDIILKRYSETRRKHPLSDSSNTLKEALERENDLLYPIANIADLTINTSDVTNDELRNLIQQNIPISSDGHLQLVVQSFGFKNGIPSDADFIFDVRCLINPHWQPELRNLSGLDKEVATFLSDNEEVMQLLVELDDFLDSWLQKFSKSNRSYINICLGCTGGQHRSVFLAEKLVKRLKQKYPSSMVRHRDLPSFK